MTKFYAHLVQAGSGCDYTISCGEKFVKLKADDRVSAIEQLKKLLEYHGALHPDSDYRMEYVSMLEIREGDEFDMSSHVAAWIGEREEEMANKDREKELAELARLTQKYKG